LSPDRRHDRVAFLAGERKRIYARRMADRVAGVMEGVAMASAVSTARPRRTRVWLGRGVFALTFTAFVAALALDVQSDSYKNLLFLGVNVVLALIGLLLTTRRPEHRISWVLAITALWERWQGTLPATGEHAPGELRVTSILRPVGGTWKVAHGHADPVKPRPGCLTAQRVAA
jgi:hypothetical protein